MKQKKRRGSRAIAVVLMIMISLLLPAFIYLSNLKHVSMNMKFYRNELAKLGVDKRINDSIGITEELLGYLKKEKEDVLIENSFFNQREKEHLLDVKRVLQGFFTALTIASILLLLSMTVLYIHEQDFWRFIKKVDLSLMIGGVLTVLLFITTVFLMNNFDSSFTSMHGMFFEENSWLFDPATNNIIHLFPEQLFYDIGRSIFFNSMMQGVVVIIITALSLFVLRLKNKKHKY